MDGNLKQKISLVKMRYLDEGFILLGIFGSYARDEQVNGSDLDLLYELNDRFHSTYVGWEACYRLQNIKSELESELGINVDLANKNALNSVGRKNILPEVLYVTATARCSSPRHIPAGG
jgi:uncharacterized protein